MRHVQLDRIEAEPHGARTAATNAARTAAMSSCVMARGVCQPAPNGIADGAMVSHGSSPAASAWPPSQGRCAEALRPAWAIWMPSLRSAEPPAMGDHARELGLAGVGIEAEAAVGDSPGARHMGGLHDEEAGAAVGRACRDAPDASHWHNRHRRCTGTWARRRCDSADRARRAGSAKTGHWSWGGRMWREGQRFIRRCPACGKAACSPWGGNPRIFRRECATIQLDDDQ